MTLTSPASLWTGVVKTFRCATSGNQLTTQSSEKLEARSSPWPKILSGYAILFAGVAPAGLALVGLVSGALPLHAVGNVVLGAAIVYFGVRVFSGDHSQAELFGLLVGISYWGLTFINFWNWGDFPPESRAAKMALPRMIRGVLFGTVYVVYFSNLSKRNRSAAMNEASENLSAERDEISNIDE